MDEISSSLSQQENSRKETVERLVRPRVLLFLSLGFFAGIVVVLLVVIFMPTPTISSQLQSGDSHICVITDQGGVKCRGANFAGQLGNVWFESEDSTDWVQVVGLDRGVKAIAAGGNQTCAVTDRGVVKCWGAGISVPQEIIGLSSGVRKIAVNSTYACALMTSGGVKCWGYYNGQFVNQSAQEDAKLPQDIPGLESGVKDIAVGWAHACGVMSNGGVKCWGTNDSGQLGNGGTLGSNTPHEVVDLGGEATAIAAGSSYTCALMSSGGVKCWGSNSSGQLGNDDMWNDAVTPQKVVGLSNGLQTIAAAEKHVCVMMSNRGVLCWGANDSDQLGRGDIIEWNAGRKPQEVVGLSGSVREIATGESYTCALMSSGRTKCWGSNKSGQLGNTWTKSVHTPQDAPEFGTVASALIAFVRGLTE